MFDAADYMHAPFSAAVLAAGSAAPFTGPFKQADNTTAFTLPQALSTSGYTTFYSTDSKQLGRYPYRNIQGFQPALSQTYDFVGDWVWDFLLTNGGAPGVAGLNYAGAISSSATVGDLSVVLQTAEDSVFTNPIDLDGFDLPLSAWVGSASFASGLAAGQYTRIRRSIPKIPQPGVDYQPTYSAPGGSVTNKLTWDAGKTYAAGDPVWYNGYIYKSKVGANTGNLPSAAASTFWAPTVWLPQYYRIKFIIANGATASNLTSFLPTVGIRYAKS